MASVEGFPFLQYRDSQTQEGLIQGAWSGALKFAADKFPGVDIAAGPGPDCKNCFRGWDYPILVREDSEVTTTQNEHHREQKT